MCWVTIRGLREGRLFFRQAVVEENGKLLRGYVYMVLASEQYDNVTTAHWSKVIGSR